MSSFVRQLVWKVEFALTRPEIVGSLFYEMSMGDLIRLPSLQSSGAVFEPSNFFFVSHLLVLQLLRQ